jgi:N-acetylmuramoyl-L-alanine amidase
MVAVVVILVVLIGWGTTTAVLRRATDAITAGATDDTTGVALDPSAFTRGACMAYPPTNGDHGETVFLDAGHGGLDPGGVGVTEAGTQINEATETLPVELQVMALLRNQGYRVVVSRTGDTSVVKLTPADVDGQLLTLQGAHDDVVARDVCANLAGAKVLVGIYYDAGGSASDAGSITAYDPDRPFAASSLDLATLLQSDVLAGLNAQGWSIPNDGVQTDNQLGSLSGDPATSGLAEEAANYNHLLLLGPAQAGYFTTPSQMPGAVIEPLYLTDPFEGTIAASTRGQTVIAKGIATAIEQYLSPPKTSTTTTAPS